MKVYIAGIGMEGIQTLTVQAEKAIDDQVLKVGLKKQDLLYGKCKLTDKINLYRDLNLDEKDIIECIEEIHFVVGDEVWENEELYNKHISYLEELEKEKIETLTI